MHLLRLSHSHRQQLLSHNAMLDWPACRRTGFSRETGAVALSRLKPVLPLRLFQRAAQRLGVAELLLVDHLAVTQLQPQDLILVAGILRHHA